MDIRDLLCRAKATGASDIHLNSNAIPTVRLDGAIKDMAGERVLTPEDLQQVLLHITTEQQRAALATRRELDFAYVANETSRFRVNALHQRDCLSFAFRVVANDVAPLSRIGLPEIYAQMSLARKGLVLVTGPTGSGKSTTLAAMINYINDTERRHIISVEDPIEFVHPNKKSVILQMEVGKDTESFSAAVRNSLRHDPDVIVLGEMRELETISAAVTAAETGHLVMGTLHTNDAAQTVDRIIDVFPYGQQQQMRHQVSQVLLAVFSQVLVNRIGGGRVPACEILIANYAVRNVIREAKTQNLQGVIQVGVKDGMQTLNQALAKLVIEKQVTLDEAMKNSNDHEQLGKIIKIMNTGEKHDFSYISPGPQQHAASPEQAMQPNHVPGERGTFGARS